MDPLMMYISRTSRCSILYRSERLEQYGLNGHQHVYIHHICSTPGISQDQLAKAIYVNKSNVARQLAQLEQNGFITRKPSDTDKRQMQVFPTEKAAAVYPKVQEILRDWNACLLEGFSETEKSMLISMLDKVMNKAISMIQPQLEQSKEPV